MDQLKHTDLRAFSAFLHGSYALPNRAAFVAHILSNLPRLVPAEATVYNEYSFTRNRIVWQQDPANFAFRGSERIWEQFSCEHPILNHFGRTKDGGAVKFSDFVSQRQFGRTSLYNEFFRPLQIRHQMTFCLREPKVLLVCIALNRTTTDFSERDRTLLNLLRPHLLAAYHNAAVVTRLSAELAQVKGVLEQLHQGVVFLSRGGKVRGMTARARELLKDYDLTDVRSKHALPEALARWVRGQAVLSGTPDQVSPTCESRLVTREGKRLLIRLIASPAQPLLVLEEHRTTCDPAMLERLGLTRRETEVLCWIAQGKTNSEIGTILAIKDRTVEKHLERIFAKLAVETRTAAAALALETIQGTSRGALALSPVALRAASHGCSLPRQPRQAATQEAEEHDDRKHHSQGEPGGAQSPRFRDDL